MAKRRRNRGRGRGGGGGGRGGGRTEEKEMKVARRANVYSLLSASQMVGVNLAIPFTKKGEKSQKV